MSTGFNVSYEIWDEEALQAGETNQRGFLAENLSLRDAIESVPFHADADLVFVEANEAPLRAFSTLSFITVSAQCFDGITYNYSIHFPDNMTPSSRLRLARYLTTSHAF